MNHYLVNIEHHLGEFKNNAQAIISTGVSNLSYAMLTAIAYLGMYMDEHGFDCDSGDAIEGLENAFNCYKNGMEDRANYMYRIESIESLSAEKAAAYDLLKNDLRSINFIDPEHVISEIAFHFQQQGIDGNTSILEGVEDMNPDVKKLVIAIRDGVVKATKDCVDFENESILTVF